MAIVQSIISFLEERKALIMGTFYIGLAAVVPLCTYLLIGVAVRSAGWLEGPALKQLNSLCFKIFLPVSMFYNIVNANIKEIFNAKMIAMALVCQAVSVAVGFIVGKILTDNRLTLGAFIHCMVQVNFMIYGTQIMNSLYGEGNIGPFALVAAIVVPMQNVISVIVLEKFSNKESNSKKLFLSCLKNPYVIALGFAILVKVLGIKFPVIINNIFRDLGRCGTPMVVIGMGAMLNISSVGKNLKGLIGLSFSKLILVPVIMLPIILKLGFYGMNLAVLLCCCAMPVAPAAFSVSVNMNSDNDFHSQGILFTTIISLFTIFGLIVILGGSL